MAFPAVGASAVLGTPGNTIATSHDMTMPATVPAGALLVVFGRTAVAGAVGMPAGWTVVEEPADLSNDVTFVGYKTAAGTEASSLVTITHGSGRMVAVAVVLTGTSASSFEVGPVNTGTSANPSSSAFTPATPIDDYLWILVGAWEGEQTQPTHPAGYTRIGYDQSGTAGGIASNSRIDVGYKTVRATNVAAASWSISVSDDWTAFAIAVRPYVPAKSTGATAGKPGTFTPPGSITPANLAAMSAAPAVLASPSTPWYDGEYVVTGAPSDVSWNGSAWVAGRGTGGAPPVPVGAIQSAWSSPGSGTSVTSVAVTLPQPVTAGDLIVVGYTRDRSAVGTDTCADNRGTAYGAPVSISDNTTNAQEYNMWTGIAPTTGTYTITVSLPSSGYVTMVVATYASIPSKTPNATANTGSSSKQGATGTDGHVGPSITTTVDGCLIIGLIGITFGATSVAPGTGYLEDVDTGNPGTPTIQLEARVQAAKGAIAPTWTLPAAENFDSIVAAFPRVVAPTGIAVKRWSGSAWVAATVKRWSGSAWVTTAPKRRDADGTWK